MDDKQMRGSTQNHADQDNFLISLDQDWQCRWWSKEFGVSPAELKAAIREVGPRSKAVREYLVKLSPH